MKIWRNKDVLLVSLGFFLIFLGFGAAQQFIIPVFKTFGGERIALTSLIILYGTFALATSLTPKIISKLGSKKSFLISNISYAAFILAIFSGNEYLLYLSSSVLGVAASMLWVNVGSYIIRITDKKERGEALGFQTALYILGNLVGVTITTFLLNIFSIDKIFLILSVFSLVGTIPFLKVKDVKMKLAGRSIGDVYKVFRNSKIIFLVPTIFLTFFLWSQIYSSINIVIQNLFGITYVGVVGTLFYLAFFSSSYILGYLTKIFKKQKILIASLTIGVIGLASFLLQSNIILSMVSVLLISIYIATGFPISLNLMKDISKSDPETVAGAFNLINSVAVLSSLVFVTLFKEITSLNTALVIGVVAIISLSILVRKL